MIFIFSVIFFSVGVGIVLAAAVAVNVISIIQ